MILFYSVSKNGRGIFLILGSTGGSSWLSVAYFTNLLYISSKEKLEEMNVNSEFPILMTNSEQIIYLSYSLGNLKDLVE